MENYQIILESVLNNSENEGKTLLLHSCCAPCSSYPLHYLANFFRITIYYYNPNIYPKEEFIRRAQEQKAFIEKLLFKYPIKCVIIDYDDKEYYDAIKGLEDEPEGGKRCYRCYFFRMRKAAIYAFNNGFDFFSTTLSVSPYKNASYINEIGSALEEEIGISFLHSDFKKKEGYKKSIEYSKKYNLYRQDYCGCKYTYGGKKNE